VPDPAPTPCDDDTSRCPLGVRCEACSVEADTLAVATRPLVLGTLCLTLCARCRASDVPPPITITTARNLVAQHGAHPRAAR
jgi:hypothetical protein